MGFGARINLLNSNEAKFQTLQNKQLLAPGRNFRLKLKSAKVNDRQIRQRLKSATLANSFSVVDSVPQKNNPYIRPRAG